MKVWLGVKPSTSSKKKSAQEAKSPFQQYSLLFGVGRRQFMIAKEDSPVNSLENFYPPKAGSSLTLYSFPVKNGDSLFYECLHGLPMIFAGQAGFLALGFKFQGRVQISLEVLP